MIIQFDGRDKSGSEKNNLQSADDNDPNQFYEYSSFDYDEVYQDMKTISNRSSAQATGKINDGNDQAPILFTSHYATNSAIGYNQSSLTGLMPINLSHRRRPSNTSDVSNVSGTSAIASDVDRDGDVTEEDDVLAPLPPPPPRRESYYSKTGSNTEKSRDTKQAHKKRADETFDASASDTAGIATTSNTENSYMHKSSERENKKPEMIDLIEEFLDFPNKYKCSFTVLTLLRFVPVPIAAICHERRIDQVFLMTNKEAKSGLITELSTHIIIDCLFLTITATPIYNNELSLDTQMQRILTVLFYLTFNIQLISILLNGILIFSLVEIPTHNIREWGMDRKACFLYVARLHIVGMYGFLGCSMLWPCVSYKFPEFLATWIAAMIPWIISLAVIGSTAHPGIFDLLAPNIKLQILPGNKRIRKLAIAESKLLRNKNPDIVKHQAKLAAAAAGTAPTTATNTVGNTTTIEIPISAAGPPSSTAARHLMEAPSPASMSESMFSINTSMYNLQHQAPPPYSARKSRSNLNALLDELPPWTQNKPSLALALEGRSLFQFLDDLELSSLLPKFEEQNVIMEMLPYLENSDFKDMGITIGDRIVIQRAMAELIGRSRAASDGL